MSYKTKDYELKEEKMRYALYKCGVCKQKFTTDNTQQWQMKGCEEGCSMVDAEEHYTREIGNPIKLKESDNLKDLEDEKD